MRSSMVAGEISAQVERQFAGIRQGKRAQVVDEMVEMLRLAMHGLRDRRCGAELAVAQRFRIAQDHAERRAQVMRDVSGHLLALLVDALQVRTHAVECLRQCSDLVTRVHRHLDA